MGYSLLIGERTYDQEYEEDVRASGFSLDRDFWCVKEMIVADAPSYPGDEVSSHRNARYPSYGAWSAFSHRVDLRDLFFDHGRYALMEDHPGIKALYPWHLYSVQAARITFQKKYPEAVPEVYHSTIDRSFTEDEERNYDLIRLLWLEWWIKYALENCTHPSFCNR